MTLLDLVTSVRSLGRPWWVGATLFVIVPGVMAEATSERVYTLQGYDRVYVHGNVDVHLIQGAASDIHVYGKSAGLKELHLETADRVLYIDASVGAADENPRVELTIPDLQEIVNDGGNVTSDGLKLPALTLEGRGNGRFALQRLHVGDLVVNGQGASRFLLSGAANNQVIELAGVGRYRGRNLFSRTSQVNVRGTGEVDVAVEELLDVVIFGAARVSYVGAPWVWQRVMGAGAVQQLN
jgi:hypothetical protein